MRRFGRATLGTTGGRWATVVAFNITRARSAFFLDLSFAILVPSFVPSVRSEFLALSANDRAIVPSSSGVCSDGRAVGRWPIVDARSTT